MAGENPRLMEWKTLKLCVFVLIVSASLNTRTIAKAQAPTIVKKAVNAVVLSLPPILLKIAECESHNRQFNPDGSVVRGKVNHDDIGRWQINLEWNGAKAKELDYDLFTEEGNEKMALYLYKTRGTQDWGWSKACWQA